MLELSSYQIDLSHSLACDVAVLTNLTPDHLDRYDGFAGYAASKARLFGLQHQDQIAIVAVDDDPSKMIASRINHRLHRVSAKDIDPVDQMRWSALQGPHNAQNAVCAIAVCRVLGLNDEQIERGLATYKSLPHRMELVGEVAGVRWFNDSKATNAASAAPALAAFPPAPDQRLHWIAGAGQGRRAGGVPAMVRSYQARLSDRRSDDVFRGRDRRRVAGGPFGRHGNCGCPGGGRGEAGRHRAAVAGMRFVRPVPGL